MAVDDLKAKEIFGEVLQLESPQSRAQHLDRVCDGDPALRCEVEQLVAAVESAGDFIQEPLVCDATIALVKRPVEGQTIGPFTIEKQIGEGGFGIVYVAEQCQPLKRKVALKILKPGMDSQEVISRFEAERQALALMDHPNISKVLDAGRTESGHPYFVMEWVQGVRITQYCDRKKLTTQQRLNLFIDVCRGVQHAHQKGIIHRDIKPTNVLVSLHDDVPVPKVIDFGVAKALRGKLTDQTIDTTMGQMLGTPMYMSPEQAELSGLDVDTRSDVYSLGVLLYELLTGTPPFEKEQFRKASLDEVRRIIRDEEPLKPSDRISTLRNNLSNTITEQRSVDVARLSKSLKGDLDWVVMKALEKDRDRRYESPAALAADLQNYLQGNPVEAGPPSKVYRIKRFAVRHCGSIATATLVLLSMTAGTGFSLRYAWQADQAAKTAETSKDLANERLKELQAKQLQLESEQEKLLDEQQLSARNLSLAKNAVAKLVDEVASQKLIAYPELSDFRGSLLETANEFYTQLIATSSGDHQLYLSRAEVRRKLNRTADAFDDYQHAVNLEPKSSFAHQVLAEFLQNTLHIEFHNPEAALDHAQRAVELSPDDSHAWYCLARIYRHIPSHRDKAVEAFLKASELSTDVATKALHLGAAMELRRKFIDAIEAYTKGIEADPPQLFHLFLSRGICFSKQKLHHLAIDDYNRAIKLNAFHYETFRRRAHAWMAINEFGKAASDWEQSHKLAVHLQPKFRGLLDCYLQIDDWSRAAALLSSLPGDYPHAAGLLTRDLYLLIESSHDDELIDARNQFIDKLAQHLETVGQLEQLRRVSELSRPSDK